MAYKKLVDLEEEQTADTPASAEISLDAVKKEIAAMLAGAKEEAQKIVDDAKASIGAQEAPGMSNDEIAKANAALEEYVEVRLFKDSGKYKDDVFVAVNGEGCLIKRGERVKIKRKFMEVLDQSDLQDMKTAKLIDDKVSEFAKTGL